MVIETALDEIKNKSIILTAPFQLENVPFNIKSYRFECNDCYACLHTIMAIISFCFWVFEKRLTQGNCFLFCKKYGLFNGYIFFNNQEIFTVPLSKLSWSVFRGDKILVFHT